MDSVVASLVTSPLSYREYLALPDDGVIFEVVEGFPVVNPSPSTWHGVMSTEFLMLLRARAPRHLYVGTAPLDWVLRQERPTHIRQPDLFVIAKDELVQNASGMLTPPLLVVEVLSPSTRRRDLVEKRAAYAAGGCEHYWILDPAVPSILALRRSTETGEYVEVGAASGEESLTLDSPFPVTVTPATLLSLD